MTIAVKLLLTVALIFSIAVPFGAFAAGEKTKGRYKTALAANTVMFFGTMLFAVCVLFGGTAFAAESTAAAGGISTGMLDVHGVNETLHLDIFQQAFNVVYRMMTTPDASL